MKPVSPLTLAYRKYRAILFATIFFSFFVNLLMFVGPLYMLQIYDRVLTSRNETTLVMLTAIAVGLLLTYGLLEYIRSRMLVRTGLQFDDALAHPLFHRVIKLQMVSPGNGNSALSDADKVRDFITGQGVLSFFDAPWVPIFLVLVYLLHPWLGMVATAGAVVIFALALLNEFMTRKRLQHANAAATEANKFASSTLMNAEVIRAMGMEKPLLDRWLKFRDTMLEDQAVASDRAGVVLATSKFVRMSLQVAILGVGAYLVLQQEITPGIMIASSIIMGRALAPAEQAVGQWRVFVAARGADQRLRTLFESIKADEERLSLPTPKGQLDVSGVTSVIPGTKTTVLRNVTFSLEPGETLAVVGPSGSGKSSLIRHLVGVWSPSAGEIRLDSAELQNWNNDELGRHMGYLPQDVKLFPGSVAENISRFEENATDEDIVAAATLAGAHELIQHFQDGYATEVGIGGSNLSGGQRQRVGLARAVYKLPSLIILDEPNSNLDSAGEEALQGCLTELKKLGKTVIVVTHKASLLALADKTLVLSNGQVQRFGYTKDVFKKPSVAAVQ
jgi:PrtD family type I secretion system ABC transporter